MRQRQFSVFAAAAMALALQTAAAVSLDDFTPRANNLASACKTLYSGDIDGCVSSDFTDGECSSTCLSALDALTASVKKACSGVSGDNIINAMLHDQGTSRICPNSNSVSAASSTAASTTSMSAPASSTATASETPVIGAGTMVLSSVSPVTTSGLLTDTSSLTSSEAAATTSSTSPTSSEVAATTFSTSTTATTMATVASSGTTSSVGILHDVTSAVSSPSITTSSSSKSVETSSSDINNEGGSPFDTSGAEQLTSHLFLVLPVALLGALLL